jgi:hypothetical protein
VKSTDFAAKRRKKRKETNDGIVLLRLFAAKLFSEELPLDVAQVETERGGTAVRTGGFGADLVSPVEQGLDLRP